MTENQVPHPNIASREDWLAKRKELLAKEKALTRQKDAVNAERRRLPMVKLEKEYCFDGPDGKKTLKDLFGDSRQLLIYHFMFGPDWEKGCMGCTGLVNAIGDISGLKERDTKFILVSRAPLSKLEAYKAEQGWDIPWYSSFGSDFNYDFHVTLDKSVAPLEYNYKTEADMEADNHVIGEGEHHGMSVFFQWNGDVYHTYSSYGRGCESLTDFYDFLDLTPYGRQEDFEDSPPGWPQKPTYG